MYFVFESDVIGHRNGYIQAKLSRSPSYDPLAPNVYLKWDKAEVLTPIEPPLPSFRFEIRKKVVHPDNYFTGASLELYSGKLLAIMQGMGVRYETFDADIYERGSDVRVLEDYLVFRLMETFSLVDPDQTVEEGNIIVRKMALRSALEKEPPPIFLDENYRHLTFVNSDLRKLIEEQNITGCSFKTIDQYVSETWPTFPLRQT